MTVPDSLLQRAMDLPSSLLTRRHGAVAVLILNRPAKRNALNDETLLGIEAFFTHLPDDVACVVLAAEGDHFSAGLDLSEMGERDTISGVRHSRMWHRALEMIEFGPVPVVCALQGAVVGGGLELAAAAHLRVAERSTFYALPEGQRGIFVGGGASVRVPRLIGVARMADLMLTGRRYDADEGLAIGLSQYVVDDGDRSRPRAGACHADRPERPADQLRRRAGAAAHRRGESARGLLHGGADGGDRPGHRRREGADASVPGRPGGEGDRPMSVGTGDVIWRPPADVLKTSRIGQFAAWLREQRGHGPARPRRPLALVGRGPGGVLVGDLGVLRRPRPRHPHRGPDRAGHARRPLVPRIAGSTTPSTRCVARARPTPTSPCSRARRPGRTVELTWGELREQVARARQVLVDLGVRPGDRVAGYLPNMPGGAGRVPGRRRARRGLDQLRRRVRAAQRDRPLRPGRAGGAAGRRRLPLRRARTSTAAPRSREIRAGLPTVRHVLDIEYGDWRVDGAPSWPRAARRRPTGPGPRPRRCRSTTRSSCCSPPAPPAGRRRSCTATAGSCSST